MKSAIGTRLLSLGFAAAVTLAILGGLDTIASTGQSSEALLARQGPLEVACLAPGKKA